MPSDNRDRCHECPSPDAPDDTRECEAADLYVRLAELIDERDAANAKRQSAEDHARVWKAAAKRARQQRNVAATAIAEVRALIG